MLEQIVRMASTNSRLTGLDLLRFVAASLVLVAHASNFGEAGKILDKIPDVFFSCIPTGWVAVDIFFVLSGFLVSGLIFREAAQTGTGFHSAAFLIRRGFKIYPAFWVMIACTVAWTLLQAARFRPNIYWANCFICRTTMDFASAGTPGRSPSKNIFIFCWQGCSIF